MLLSVQESLGEQYGALERLAAVVARAHRVGDQEGYGAHRFGAHLRRRGGAAKTTGKSGTYTYRLPALSPDLLSPFLRPSKPRGPIAELSSQFVQTPFPRASLREYFPRGRRRIFAARGTGRLHLASPRLDGDGSGVISSRELEGIPRRNRVIRI